MAATWGTPTTWADFLTWAGDTGPAPTTSAAAGGSPYIEAPRINVAALDDDLLLV